MEEYGRILSTKETSNSTFSFSEIFLSRDRKSLYFNIQHSISVAWIFDVWIQTHQDWIYYLFSFQFSPNSCPLCKLKIQLINNIVTIITFLLYFSLEISSFMMGSVRALTWSICRTPNSLWGKTLSGLEKEILFSNFKVLQEYIFTLHKEICLTLSTRSFKILLWKCREKLLCLQRIIEYCFAFPHLKVL